MDKKDFITQVIPCIRPLYARYREDDEREFESPIDYLGLCANGEVRPLKVCEDIGVDFADVVDNYVGLYNESLDTKKGGVNEDNDTKPDNGH